MKGLWGTGGRTFLEWVGWEPLLPLDGAGNLALEEVKVVAGPLLFPDGVHARYR